MNDRTRVQDPMMSEVLTRDSGGVPEGMALAAVKGELVTGANNDIVTAQRVAKPRSDMQIKAKLKALAVSAGSRYYYSWEVNDRANNRKVLVEGLSIKGANAVAREFGNCMINTRVVDSGTHWLFLGRFVDLETGYTTERAFQQRKAQNVGMKDVDRGLDMVFQIGQSKCIRNVIVNALEDLCDFTLEIAKGALLERVQKDPKKASAWILQTLTDRAIPVLNVEAVYGRKAEHWTVRDLAKIYTELSSIEDGMMNAADVYPAPADEAAKRSNANPLADDQQRKDVGSVGAQEQEGGAKGAQPSAAGQAGNEATGGAGTPPSAGSAEPPTAGPNAPPPPAREPSPGPRPPAPAGHVDTDPGKQSLRGGKADAKAPAGKKPGKSLFGDA